MTNTPIQVTDQQFEEYVLKADLPVVVDFWAPWCGPCKMVSPILEKIAQDYSGRVIITKVNTDENQTVANNFKIQGIPTLLFIYSGKVVHRQVGALPEPALREVIDQFLEIIDEANE